MATIKDVARLAGVSIATVSNYLNNTKQVSKESAQKIQNAVDELHYTLNQNARSLNRHWRHSSQFERSVLCPVVSGN